MVFTVTHGHHHHDRVRSACAASRCLVDMYVLSIAFNDSNTFWAGKVCHWTTEQLQGTEETARTRTRGGLVSPIQQFVLDS